MKKYNLNYINNLISSKAEESLNLEFKRSDSVWNNSEIAKDISAIANSAGGIIIYGLIEEDHKADSIDCIDGNKFTKETLERIIKSRIHRQIEGLYIEPIRIDDNISKTVYVVEIPESKAGPHMAGGKYYRRTNFEVSQMEEYMVRAMYFKSNSPNLELVNPIFHFDQSNYIKRNQNNNLIASINGYLVFHVNNIGKIPCKEYKIELILPKDIIGDKIGNITNPIKKFPARNDGKNTAFEIKSNSTVFGGEKMSRSCIAQINIAGSNYESYKKGNIIQRLYFEGGVISKSWKLADIVKVNNNVLNGSDFMYWRESKLNTNDFTKGNTA